ncbi:NTP transferase domain-containing protein [Olivibacter domesticus]|uniref:Probable molybdenum cofactor guanylyltransferase n=1 Tax=Olivibacter domesticus TaxID=407022 RepID=A0A1H7MU29_OLID1|nr:NTP transferase domain-containing protein [Olivibacter domesticus]SEL14559.1 molybdopterin-guanine dinucleotide biosynthesis protein A [Olivibacter domesticus]
MILKESNTPVLNGLVLAGGKSKRMGTNKDLIKWHGKAQRYHVADMLKKFCKEVFISCRQEQVKEFNPAYKSLPDTFLNMGPFGGILSALQAEKDKAWLVIACDLPLLNEETIQFLVDNRDPQKSATTYESPFDGLPEPLMTIWEPRCYSTLLDFLEKGITSPRKVLLSSDETLILKSSNPEALINVNTPEDLAQVKKILSAGIYGSSSISNNHS